MATHRGEKFLNERIAVDGNEYRECTFSHCTLLFEGRQIPTMANINMNHCVWEFVGAAKTTMNFLILMYHRYGDGGRDIVESMFKSVRDFKPPPPPPAAGSNRTET
jgi:hypothetical protein